MRCLIVLLVLFLFSVAVGVNGKNLRKGISRKGLTMARSKTKKREVKTIRDRNSWEDDDDGEDDSDDLEAHDSDNDALKEHRGKVTETSLPKSFDTDSMYQIIATYLSEFSEDNSILHRTPIDELERALHTLANAQAAWKSVDGATHQLKSSVKASSTSLDSRFRRFLARKTKSTKEAAKINEYIDVVERGLQCTEILQTIIQEASNERRRRRLLQEAGLKEIARFSLHHTQHRDVSVLVTVLLPSQNDNSDNSARISSMEKFEPNEIVIAITDNVENDSPELLYNALFRIAEEELPVPVPISAKALADFKSSEKRKTSPPSSEILVLSSLLEMAQQIVSKVQPFIASTWNDQQQLNETSVSSDVPNDEQDSIGDGNVRKLPSIRVIGHSCGGTIAGYVSMLLDKFIATNNSDSSSMIQAEQVKCMTLGAMPCVSRSVIPAFVTSLMCGDDFLCRLQRTNLKNLQKKVSEAVTHGAGKKGLSWFTGVSLLSELSHTASKQLGHYQGRKKEFQDTLQLPGRVFYIKSRQLKQGATLQRVLRGNWQEEVMWNIRDFVLSPKMLKHHELESYIRTLNRC